MILLQTNTDLFFETDSFKAIRAVIEIIYLLAAPVVAYLAYRGLEQIKFAKKESKLNSKREAYKVTAELCKDYGYRIIPLLHKLYDKINEENILFFKESKAKIEDDEISVDYGPIDFGKCAGELVDGMNALEGFSVFFVNGLGDEKIAYNSFGQTFIDSVKYYCPFLVLVNKNKYYSNVLQLFIIWNIRNEKETLELEKETLEKKIKSKQTVRIKHLGEE